MERRTKLARRPRMLFFVVLGTSIAALGWLGSVFVQPFMKAADMARENERLEKQSMEAEIRRQYLRKDHAAIQTDAGMEREARKRGYIKANEAHLIIPEISRESDRP